MQTEAPLSENRGTPRVVPLVRRPKTDEKINLLGLNQAALNELILEWGDKPFRARQLPRWIHQRACSNFDDMTDLAKVFREKLQHKCTVTPPTPIWHKVASDKTRKWLFSMGENNAIETVFIPEDDRGTLCISSQVGCTVGCRFCSTGHQGFWRNLSTAEIVGQLWYARRELMENITESRMGGHVPAVNEHVVSNVVMMGMGEPLLNYRAVVESLDLMLDTNAYGLSRRRVTVSTSGVVPAMYKLMKDCPVALAVSLHAPNDYLRDQLVPLNQKYPLKELIQACNDYLGYAPREFITFEYIMLDGVNDTDEHAKELIEIARQVPCKMNLIPFNPFPASGLKRSTPARVKQFAARLMDANIVTTVRKTRGDDIDAACGQLAGEVTDRTKIKQKMAERKLVPIYQERVHG